MSQTAESDKPEMRHLNEILIAVAVFFLMCQRALACTGFALNDGRRVLACLSYDQQFGAGYIHINQRNVERRRYSLYAEKPLSWVSKYGSITFNLAGRDYPHDGMNEAGLVVLSMGLDDTRFPEPDARPAIDELGWIQYQLDQAASVDEVIQSLKTIRISSRSIGDSHYLIVDNLGKAAVIEYPDGQARLYTGNDLPYTILANDTYVRMLGHLKQQKAFGGLNEDEYRVSSSCSRFTQVARDIRDFNSTNGTMLDRALAILHEVRQSNSQYQAVYDISNRRILYRSHNSIELKTIELGKVDFDCYRPGLMTEIQSTDTGNIRSRFYEYDRRRSRASGI